VTGKGRERKSHYCGFNVAISITPVSSIIYAYYSATYYYRFTLQVVQLLCTRNLHYIDRDRWFMKMIFSVYLYVYTYRSFLYPCCLIILFRLLTPYQYQVFKLFLFSIIHLLNIYTRCNDTYYLLAHD